MDKNKLFYGDNLDVMHQQMKDESVDLCYIDPPFNSKRNYNQIYNNIGKEDAAQAQVFVDTWTWNEAADTALQEIINPLAKYPHATVALIKGLEAVLKRGALLAYLVSITQRVREIHRVLRPTGSFYLHCDPTANHYLKLILDTIFCTQGGDYKNEIVWCYKERELSRKHFNKKHDVIFFYTKGDKYTFNPNDLLEAYSQGTIKKFNYTDENGRKFQIRGKGGKYTSKQGLKLELETTDPTLVYRDYLDKSKGILPRDWWEIPFINRAAKERLGYPTQKPEALLERIIKASSNEGDVVFDAYCGCGTTIAVAQRLGRKWVGIDITYQSISLIMKRLEKSFGETSLAKQLFSLGGIPEDFASAVALANKVDDRVRKEFEKWLVLTYTNNRAIINDKKGGDGGIDGRVYAADYDAENKVEHLPVILSVKSSKTLSPAVTRELFGTITREKAVMGILLTLYKMDNLVKDAKIYGFYENKIRDKKFPIISVVSVEEILAGARLELPVAVEVVKSAVAKENDQTGDLFEQDDLE